ncbi:MAG TPA: AAA family ATPase [Eubacteriales bacterium]|nr:AAA family ATPase [Eubacteriales bacterium]
MNLKKIEIYGFKSFSDKLAMSFDYPVTGVVGPNGCGKSNVVDATRWVLGEQSAKALRGKTMQDLIFSGTEERKSMSYCEVALFMDNKNRIFPIEMDEVVISRKLYRNNESEYFLNKNLVRLKDISDILRDAGLGREGYSIVGQGRMDAILNARPEDRRAIFEEALGISKFRVRKVETERKLEKTRDNMSQLYIILNELERQLAPLKKQAADAEKFFALSEKLKYHEINAYIYGYDTASEKKAELKKVIADLDEKVAAVSEKYAESHKKYENLYLEINNIDALLNDYRKTQLELSVKIERQTGESKVLNERVKYLQNASEDFSRQIEDAQATIARVKKTMEDTAKAQQEKRSEHEAISKTLAQLNEHAIGFSDKLVAFQDKVEQAQKQVVTILNELSVQKSRSSALNSEKNTLGGRLERVNRDIDEVNRKIQQLSDEQSADIDCLIEGNYAIVTADKLAADVDGYVSVINSLLDKVVLSGEIKTKVTKLLEKVSNAAITELRLASNLERQNWQQNLILMSALKERFSKYAALHETQRQAMNKLTAEKDQLTARLAEIEKSLSASEASIEILNQRKDTATGYSEQYQKEYNSVKTQKDKAQEEITATKLKIANLTSNILAGENSINGNKQLINRLTAEIAQKTRQIENNKVNIEELYKQIANCGGNAEDSALLAQVNEKLSETGKLKSDLQTQFSDVDRERQYYSAETQKFTELRTKEEYNLLRIDDDINALQEKILNEYELTYSSAMRFKDPGYDLSKSSDEINKLRSQLSKLAYVNPNAVKDYNDTLLRYDDINAQLDDMKKAEADLKNILKELTREIVVRFNDGFEIISHNFGVIFQELFAGGHARMSIEEEEGKDELDFGVEIEAQPPGKRLQNISLLSGGERTLTAAAILFAILKLRPMPFCVLDEIEAALDEANAERIAKYIKKFSSETQFIVITHKKPTMESCDVLYGVTMEEKGVSKIVSVQLTEAVKTAV